MGHHELIALSDFHQLTVIGGLLLVIFTGLYLNFISRRVTSDGPRCGEIAWSVRSLFEVLGHSRFVNVRELFFVFIVEHDLPLKQALAELNQCGQIGHLERLHQHVIPYAEHLSNLADLVTPVRRLQLVFFLSLVSLKLQLETEENHARGQNRRPVLVKRCIKQD